MPRTHWLVLLGALAHCWATELAAAHPGLTNRPAILTVRTLLQDPAPAPPAATRVATPQALRDAAARGDARIIVTAHLDFTTLETLTQPAWGFNAGAIGINASVQSITGDCGGVPLPQGVALRLEATGAQPCVIQIFEDGVDIVNDDTGAPRSVALSQLYFQIKTLAAPERTGAAFLILRAGSVFLTEVYLEGQGLESRGIDAQNGSLFMSHSKVGFMRRPYGSAVALSPGVALTARDSAFISNSVLPQLGLVDKDGPALWVPATAAAIVERCAFANNTPIEAGNVAVINGSARRVFADDSVAEVVDVLSGQGVPPRRLSQAPDGIAFLTGEEPFYVENHPDVVVGPDPTQPVMAPPPTETPSPGPTGGPAGGASMPPSAESNVTSRGRTNATSPATMRNETSESGSGGGGGGGSGLSSGAIAGMAAAGALLVGLIAVVAAYVHRRKTQSVMQLVGPLAAKTPQGASGGRSPERRAGVRVQHSIATNGAATYAESTVSGVPPSPRHYTSSAGELAGSTRVDAVPSPERRTVGVSRCAVADGSVAGDLSATCGTSLSTSAQEVGRGSWLGAPLAAPQVAVGRAFSLRDHPDPTPEPSPRPQVSTGERLLPDAAQAANRPAAGPAHARGSSGRPSNSLPPASLLSSAAPVPQEAVASLDGTSKDTATTRRSSTVAKAPSTGGEADRRAALIAALDAHASAEPPEPFAKRFYLLASRASGSQAVVNFARAASGRAEQFAVKLFTHSAADYDHELALYQVPALQRALPRLVRHCANAEQTERSAQGYVWPPYIVLERGATLHAWLRGRNGAPRSFAEALAMFEQLADLLAALHGSGRVHRDLKPANVLWMLDSMVWRLLDLGIVEAIGARAFPRCTPGYAAPEVVTALEREAHIVVQPSQDVWALGVLVFEAVTNVQPFPQSGGAAAPYFCAAGDRAYPWEGPAAPAAWRRSRLKPLAMRCLARDPLERPTAAELVADIAHMGSTTATASGPTA